MEKKDRDLNLDVLKIIIMLMVMCLHYLSHQNFLHMYEIGTPMYFMSWFLYGVCVVSVDVFVIITGYFMCGRNFKPEKHVHRVLDILLCMPWSTDFRKNVLWNKIVNTDLLVTGKFSIILLPALMIITVIAIYILFACFHNFVIKEFISKKVMNSDICGKSKKLIINSKIYSLYMRFISGF